MSNMLQVILSANRPFSANKGRTSNDLGGREWSNLRKKFYKHPPKEKINLQGTPLGKNKSISYYLEKK